MVGEGWVQVAAVDDVPVGTGFMVEIDGYPIAIWNVDGELYATQDECTHEETSLAEGDLWDEVIECPLHGAQFDVRTGAVLSLPAVRPLRTFPVRAEGDAIYVEWTE
jgi:3-phenylpropionate/trans-cinnamate dioxygenase ferredoxin component